MKQVALVSVLVSAVLVIGAGQAWSGQALVGQRAPEIAVGGWVNSPPLSLQQLRGRIVVVEFWATWCPPCRTSIPHLIELHGKYGPKGVVILGLSDETKVKVEPFAASMGMTYPVAYGTLSMKVYGVSGIPSAFLVDPSGVIVWAGHPMSETFEPAIEAQLQKTPPTLMSAQDRAAAAAMLDKTEEAVKKGDYVVAAALLARAKGADQDPQLKDRVVAVQATLAAQAAKRLADSETQVKSKAYYEASVALGDVTALAAGTDLAVKARDQLAALLKDDEIRAAIDRGKREKEAADALAAVEEQASKKSPVEMLGLYDDVATRFADTKAGKVAAEKAGAMRADSTLMAKVRNAAAEKDCKGWLSMARNLVKAGLNDKARPYLQQVIEKYPDTDYAKEARAELNALGQ